MSNPFKTLAELPGGYAGKPAQFHSLPLLEKAGVGPISRLPVSIRIVLESVLRNCDGQRVSEKDVHNLAQWNAAKPAELEIPFVVARVVLQDFTGVPLLVDLAAMRSAVARLGRNPEVIEPLVPVDLVVDHSVQVDRSGTAEAFSQNLDIEFERNRERYEFLKWGQQAFKTFGVVPPAIGIVHQVNLEHLARVVFTENTASGTLVYPDTLVGTDSHTTMINGIGIVGWGVGGIEAEAGMLGQPVYFLTPEVIGVNLTGRLREGVTATDLVLHVTQMLRKEKVVGKFVEFFGTGSAALSLADRATIGNMAPEYGATMGFFPIDEESLNYLRATGRSEEQIDLVRRYYKAQGMFGMPQKGDIDYTKVVDLDLSTVQPGVAGPKRPQDRINVQDLKAKFAELLTTQDKDKGYSLSAEKLSASVKIPVNGLNGRSGGPAGGQEIRHGSVLIAAITSCTNTSNPSVMIGAGLVAKKAVEKGLTVSPLVKTSLAPGSRVVTDYLNATGLQSYLDTLGFNLVGYGCTTCIGNSGPLEPTVEKAIVEKDIVAASVLSGNRNFEARVHGAIKANFLMSPPLVVAYAIAGRVDIDLTKDPIGTGKDGKPVYLKDVWPTDAEVAEAVRTGLKPEMFTRQYANVAKANEKWLSVAAPTGQKFAWDEASTYIQEPPFFGSFSLTPGTIPTLNGLRPLAILGDSVTTDHISPAGSFGKSTPAGKFLLERGVAYEDFNSYGSRRGNDRIMTRGTFANVRVKNRMADGKEGGFTKLMPEGTPTTIFDACDEYRKRGTGLIVFAGLDYGMGSSRDWAAKGTALLGVKAVVARSYERIHRSNLVGMGVLPLQFLDGVSAETLGLDGSEILSLPEVGDNLKALSTTPLIIERKDGRRETVTVSVRVDTPIELEYLRHGGILPYVLRQILSK